MNANNTNLTSITPIEFLHQYYYLMGCNAHEIEYILSERGWKKKSAELFADILGVPFGTAYDWTMGNDGFFKMPAGYQVALSFYLRLLKSRLVNKKLKQQIQQTEIAVTA